MQGAIEHQEGEHRDHIQEVGRYCFAGSRQRVHHVDHGETHLKANKLATCLHGREKKLDHHAHDQAEHDFAQKHQGYFPHVGGHECARKGELWPDREGQDQHQGGLDRVRDGFSSEERQ